MLYQRIFMVCLLIVLHTDWIYATPTLSQESATQEKRFESKDNMLSAFLQINENHDLEGIEQQIQELLSQYGIVWVENSNMADYIIDLSSSLTTQDVITSGVSDLNTCYCNLVLQIYEGNSHKRLFEYSLNEVRILTPADKSYEQTLSMCKREVIRLMRSELPKQLNKSTIFIQDPRRQLS